MRHLLFLSFILLIPLFGCGDDTSVASITIYPAATVVVGINKTQQFQAVGYTATGKSISITPVWNCSPAIGSIDNSGLLTAVGVSATGVVVASAGGISASNAVSVTDKATLSGVVRNSQGEAVANVIIDLGANNTLSNSSGVYSFTNLTAGPVTATSRANATYLSGSVTATLVSGETKQKDFTLPDRFSVIGESFNPTSNTDGTISMNISGSVVNNGTTTATGISVMYLFSDSTGQPVGVVTASVGTLASGATGYFNATGYPPLSDAYTSYTRTVGAQTY